MRALLPLALTLAVALPGSALACAMPAHVVAPVNDPKLVVEIGPGAQLEALFRSIEVNVDPPAVVVPVTPPKTGAVPPASTIPELPGPVVPEV